MESTRIWGDGNANAERIRINNPDEPLELSVSEHQGSITVRTDERDDVLVRAERGDGANTDASVRIGYEGNRIEIRPEGGRNGGPGPHQPGEDPKGNGSRFKIGPIEIGGLPFSGFSRGDAWFDIEIVVPRAWMPSAGGPGGRFHFRNASGDIDLKGIGGQIDAMTASGSIDLADITGNVAVNTASGDVNVTGLQGDLLSRTASGDVDVSDSAITTWSLTTASGEIEVQAALIGTGPYRIQTVNGDIYLDLGIPNAGVLDEDRSCVLTWQSVSGRADVEEPFMQVDRRVWRFGPEGVEPTPIEVRTVSGDLTAEVASVFAKADWAQPTATAPAGKSDAQETPVDPFERGMRRFESEVESALQSVDRAVADLETRFGWDLGNVRNLTGNRQRERQPQYGEAKSGPDVPPTPETPPTPLAPSVPPTLEAPATPPTPDVPATPPTAPGTPATPPTPVASSAREPEAPQSAPYGEAPSANWFAPNEPTAPGEVAKSDTVPSASAEDTAEADRLRILMALERNELTVEEAMRRLEELGPNEDQRPAQQ